MIDRKSFLELTRSLKLINEVDDLLLRATEETVLLNEVCRLIVDVGGYRLAWVGLAQGGEGKKVIPAATYGIARDYVDGISVSWDAKDPFGQGPTGRAIRNGTTVTTRVSENAYSPWRERAEKYGLGASTALPMHLGNDVIGALSIYAQDENAFSDDEVMLLERMADNLAYGLEKLHIAAELKRIHRAIEELGQPLFITDKSGKIEYVNKAFEELTGYARRDVIGKSPSILKSSAHSQEFYDSMWNTLLKGHGWKGKIINRMKDGREREEYLAITPLKGGDGSVTGFACLVIDYTWCSPLPGQ